MQVKHHKAFTMIELTFVIVIIGILSAVALPKFGGVSEDAYLTKAKTTLITVRVAIKTERQRRVLRGDFTQIGDLGDANNAFSLMQADADNNQAEVFTYPIVNCAAGQKACWDRVDATNYSYRFPASGQADFVLNPANSTLNCAAADTTDCEKIIK